MKLVRVGAGILNQIPLDWAGNGRRILSAIEAARAARVSVLCLPELCITGYGCEDAFLAREVADTALAVLARIVPATAGMAVSLGLPLLHRNGLYNVAALVADGRLLGFVGKRFLAGDGIHYEPRWFKAWPDGVVSEHVGSDGARTPLGDLHFELGGLSVGFEICEDAWVADRPGAALSRKGVDLLLNPSASHFAFGKHEVRKRFVLEGSRAFGVTYVYANLVGNEAGRAIYDGGALIASGGALVAEGPRFSFAESSVTTAVVDLDRTRTSQARSASFRGEAADDLRGVVRAPFALPDVDPEPPSSARDPWDGGPATKNEEFTRAMAIGLHDYLRKSHSSGFVVSLSGGADSSAVACLVAMMARLGIDELGLDGFTARVGLRLPPGAVAGERAATVVRHLLTTAYQATRQSGAVTREAARAVADAVGADHLELDVDALVTGYTDLVGRALGRPLAWATDDIALQNIQARVRAPSVWMIANLRNALLLATSNRSEAAVGYATMDGDTAGGLSPIAGIDKAFLRQYLVWLEREGPHGLGPIPALAAVNRQAPTAELRPAAAAQTDEADLMPYDLLDAVERAAIRDKEMPVAVYRRMRVLFPRHSAADLGAWVERFFRLWCRNQWKRERYAPSFHVDDENLDPKTWCRFPILSSGFEEELAALRAFVAAHP